MLYASLTKLFASPQQYVGDGYIVLQIQLWLNIKHRGLTRTD